MSTVLEALSAAGRTAGGGSAGSSSTGDIENRFLTLLVTQLQNQDPLNPMDNAQVTSQLAQISTVNGIDKLNATLTAMSSAFLAGQSLAASSMIGRQVVAPGNGFALAAGGTASGAFDLGDAADRVKVTITSAAGAVVRQLDLGARSAGQTGFTWDGRNAAGTEVAPGNYTFRVEASREGKAVVASTLTVGTVTAVGLSRKEPMVSVQGVGDVPLAQVQRIQ